MILKPSKNIKQVLEKYGYPFKSKEHSLKVGLYQRGSRSASVMKYKNGGFKDTSFQCPDRLKYQYDDSFKLKLSEKCCYKLKKEPVKKWKEESGRTISILGLRSAEGGQRRNSHNCIVVRSNKVVKFSPLLKVNDEWEEWFIKTCNIRLCDLYYPPYNFERTGCKGCPFAINLQKELDVLEKYLPNEKKQCEIIWKPVYDEYRRIGYRLRKKGLF